MRNFADLVKLPPANKQPVVLQKVINSVAKLMSIKAQEKEVEFEFNLAEADMYIMADEQQLLFALALRLCAPHRSDGRQSDSENHDGDQQPNVRESRRLGRM